MRFLFDIDKAILAGMEIHTIENCDGRSILVEIPGMTHKASAKIGPFGLAVDAPIEGNTCEPLRKFLVDNVIAWFEV